MSKNCVNRAFSVSVFAGLVLWTTVATAGPAETCRMKQIAAVGKACSTILKKCYGGPAKSGLVLDRICLDGARVSFNGAMDKAEEDGTCDQSSIDATVWSRLFDSTEDIADGELSYLTEGVCAAKKLKAAAKDCQSVAKCYASAAKVATPFTVDSACLSNASAKLLGAFLKIDSSGTCTTTGNGADVQTLVSDLLADLSAVYTTGTTTTTNTIP
jgi:hypothetical protein